MFVLLHQLLVSGFKFILFISMGKVEGGTAPIFKEGFTTYSNPLPSVLILTAIVVGVATTALALSGEYRGRRGGRPRSGSPGS